MDSLNLLQGSQRTTMIYTHVLNRGWGAVRSPADTVLRSLRGPSLTPGSLRALDCGALQPSAPAMGPAGTQERVCWQDDSGHVPRPIAPR